jgi:hypothetical protein
MMEAIAVIREGQLAGAEAVGRARSQDDVSERSNRC